MTHTIPQIDSDGNSILTVDRERNHDETATGALGNPTTTPKARVSYSASYFDKANRLTGTVDVGTNGGTAWTRPSTIPAASDTALVTLDDLETYSDPRGVLNLINKLGDNYHQMAGKEFSFATDDSTSFIAVAQLKHEGIVKGGYLAFYRFTDSKFKDKNFLQVVASYKFGVSKAGVLGFFKFNSSLETFASSNGVSVIDPHSEIADLNARDNRGYIEVVLYFVAPGCYVGNVTPIGGKSTKGYPNANIQDIRWFSAPRVYMEVFSLWDDGGGGLSTPAEFEPLAFSDDSKPTETGIKYLQNYGREYATMIAKNEMEKDIRIK